MLLFAIFEAIWNIFFGPAETEATIVGHGQTQTQAQAQTRTPTLAYKPKWRQKLKLKGTKQS